MKKLLTVFAVLALVVCVVAVFAPAVRAGPAMDPTEAFFATAIATANCEAWIVALSPSSGLSTLNVATVVSDTAIVAGNRTALVTYYCRPVKEWVRNRSERVRTTKWPGTLIASAIHFNLLERV